jgi:hypothetical protein
MEALAHRDMDLTWIKELKASRHLFIHETAPWPALEITSQNPFRCELVLLKKNIQRLDNPKDYLHLGQCRSIYRGFVSSFDHIEAWLRREIQDYEQRESGLVADK